MKTSLKIVDQWCGSQRLGANLNKTEVVRFSKKIKGRIRQVNFKVVLQEFRKEVMYLGVHLDPKLD